MMTQQSDRSVRRDPGNVHLDAGHLAYLQTREEEYRSDLESGKIERSNFETNKEFLASTNRLRDGLKALEIGCGAGSMTAYLHAKGLEVIGTDVSDVLLEYASKHHPECCFEKMMGERLTFDDGAFDLVISFDVFEHIPNIERHLREVRRVLSPHGCYLLQTPNKWTNLPFCILKDRSFTRWKNYHPSLQTKRSLTRLMGRIGFSVRIVRIKVSSEFFKRKLVFPLNLIDVNWLPIQTNLYVIAHQGGDRL
jgi:2-polyprenyl-3-methyl-5-hydroxy-6-metoxy-1,4-benzoquinol methylase